MTPRFMRSFVPPNMTSSSLSELKEKLTEEQVGAATLALLTYGGSGELALLGCCLYGLRWLG